MLQHLGIDVGDDGYVESTQHAVCPLARAEVPIEVAEAVGQRRRYLPAVGCLLGWVRRRDDRNAWW